MTCAPPSPMAPKPYSGWNGTPSLRTMITSRGACSSRATSAATGTPPCGKASTTTSVPRRCDSDRASRRPASARSANSIALPPHIWFPCHCRSAGPSRLGTKDPAKVRRPAVPDGRTYASNQHWPGAVRMLSTAGTRPSAEQGGGHDTSAGHADRGGRRRLRRRGDRRALGGAGSPAASRRCPPRLRLSHRHQAACSVRPVGLGARGRAPRRRSGVTGPRRAPRPCCSPPGWLVAELVDEPPARALLERAAGAEMLVLGTSRPPAQPGLPPLAIDPVARV